MDESSEQEFRWADSGRPSGARLYDFMLGGSYNFAVDRAVAEELLESVPEAYQIVRANRQFLHRAVRFCVRRGIDQFVDLGSGVPTAGNVHEVAQEMNPLSRVVYVDNDPIAAESTKRMLAANERVGMVPGDLRNAGAVLSAEATRELVDFTRPVALVAVASLHNVGAGEDLPGIIGEYRAALGAGSHFVISHFVGDDYPRVARLHQEFFSKHRLRLTLREQAELRALLTPFRLVEPGLVPAPQWRPEGHEEFADQPTRSMTYAAVGVKPD